VIRAGEVERRQLNDTFVELCRIESPSGSERACAERVERELTALGLDVSEDDAGPAAGADCGNLLARIDGMQERGVLLCAHLDTVPPLAPIEPQLVDGAWQNANEGILGADNKAAVAVLLALARRYARERPPLGIELLFTVSEENGLRGATHFDRGALRSDFGYAFDHATPIGEIVVASPTYFRIEAELHGAAAHAGLRPEQGRSAIVAAARAIAAMQLGRLDAETTANVGEIHGGTAGNVVPERCTILAEARGLDAGRAQEAATAILDAIHDACNAPDCECDADVAVAKVFDGYKLSQTAPAVEVAAAALRDCGHEPRPIRSGGGSDANALIANGFECVNLANGTERNHEPGERVSVAALEEMLDVSLALVARAAALGRVAEVA
jgi:tripeptide aminopeptidase